MISTTPSSVIVYGNGSSYSFNFPFVGVSSSNIQVSYTDTLGNQTVLSPTSYTVTFNSPSSGQIWGIGGTITYPLTGSPIANTTYLTISRVLPLVQNTSISNQGNFYPSAVEAAIDTLCMEIQQVSNRTSQFRGTWITNTIYNIGDIVQDGVHGASTFNLCVCANGNTSSVWATDLAAGDWVLAFSAASLNPSTGYLPLTGGTISGSLAVSGNVSASNLNVLSSNLTLYVATTGSDSNNGTSGSPFLTLQHAITVAFGYNLNGYTLTIQHANGSYAGATVNRPFVNGTVIINGTSSVIITSLLTVQNNALITIQNLEFLPTTGNALQASAGGIAYLGVGIVFGAAAGYSQCLASEGGKIFFNAAYTISGGASSHWYVTDSGEMNSQGQTVTLTGTPAFSGTFAHADLNGLINFANSTFTGSATGSRFLSELNASIWDGGAGLSALPGNVAGTWNSGGIYSSTGGYGTKLINTQYLYSGTTYTPTTGTSAIKYIMIGGGGGGGGSGASGSGGNGGAGGNTYFLNSTVSVAGGSGGGAVQIGGAGGASGTVSFLLLGSSGQSGGNVVSSSGSPNGGDGGSGIYGSGKGKGGGGSYGGTSAGAANTGAGGGGGSGNGLLANGAGGGGGGAIGMGYVTGITGTYTYAIGAGGTAGAAGTSGYAGAAGGNGCIIVEEYS